MKNIPIRSITAAESKKDFSESFKIRRVTDILAGKNMAQDLHRHDFYFILALRKGIGSHEIDFMPHAISDDSISFMRPGQVHRLELNSRSTGHLMEFGKDFFHFNGMNQIFRRGGNSNFCKLDANTSEKLQTILKAIHEEYSNQNEGFQEIIKANLTIFFTELARQRTYHVTDHDRGLDYAHERLHDFVEQLEKNIRTHKQVSHYADQLNLSRFQLNSITKTLLGKTAAEVIDDHILLEAKRYLLATPSQVNQIAYHLGYDDVSYFIRFFKKHTGSTPENFRRNLR